MYLMFTHKPGEVRVGNSGLCCYIPCLLGSMNSLRSLIFKAFKRSFKTQKTFKHSPGLYKPSSLQS